MKIFQKVHCVAYLKKYSDGVHLECSKMCEVGSSFKMEQHVDGNLWSEPINVIAVKDEYKDGKWTQTEIADLSNFEGESVEKQYRVRVEEEFDGFLVGITHITTNGRIGTDMSHRLCNMAGDMAEVYHLTKETEQKKVGVVYFKNNAKRYVLLADMRGEE